MTSGGYEKGTLGFNLGSGDKKDTLFAVALVVIVAGAIALTVYEGFFRGSDKDFVFECTSCHHEFRVDYEDKEVLASSMGPAGITKPCPKCGAKGLFTTPCPKCANHILQQNGKCPDCGADIQEELNKKVQAAIEAKRKR